MLLLVLALQCAWTESFDTQNYFPPNDWTIVNEDVLDALWYQDPNEGHTGLHSATCNGDTMYYGLDHTNLDYLITPQVLPQGGDTTISFWCYATTTAGCSLDVMVSSASPFTMLSFSVLETIVATETTWTQYTISVAAYSSPIYIAFRVRRIPTNEQFHLDDITLPSMTTQPILCNGRLRTKGLESATISCQKYLQIWGSHYEMGYAYGFLLGEEIMANILRAAIGTTSWQSYTPSQWENVMIPYYNSHFSVPQKYLDEAQGMCLGCLAKGVTLYHPDLGRNITPTDILCLNILADVDYFMGCSSMSGWGQSTINDDTLHGGIIVARNYDLSPSLYTTLGNTSLTIAFTPSTSGEQKVAVVTLAGFLVAYSGINSSGIGGCLNLMNHPDTGYIAPNSLVPIGLSIRDALEAVDPDSNGTYDIYDIVHSVDHSTCLGPMAAHLFSPYDTLQQACAAIWEMNNVGDSLRLTADNGLTPHPINSDWNLALTNHYRVLYTPEWCSRYRYMADSINADIQLNTERAIRIIHTAAQSYNTIHTMVFRPDLVIQHPDWPFLGVSYSARYKGAHTRDKIFYSWSELFEGIPGVEEETGYTLQNTRHNLNISPNPFSKLIQIRYSILDTRYSIRKPTIAIHDVSGRLVKFFNLESTIQNQESVLLWHGDDDAGRKLPSGVYFVKFTSGDYQETEKVLLVR